MMRLKFITALTMSAFVLTACDVPYEGFNQRELDSFISAMISEDCVANFHNASVIEKATGFTEDKLRAITDYLKEARQIEEVQGGSGIRLLNEGCS